jgi:hypothetical protein
MHGAPLVKLGPFIEETNFLHGKEHVSENNFILEKPQLPYAETKSKGRHILSSPCTWSKK